MPEQIKNIIDILEKIWQGIANTGFLQTAWDWAKNVLTQPGLIFDTLKNWFDGLNGWLTANAGVSLSQIFKAIIGLFVWLFRLVLKIIQFVVDSLEKLN